MSDCFGELSKVFQVTRVWFLLDPDPCLSPVRQNAAVVGHDVRFFIDHAQEKFGVPCSIETQDSAPLCQDLLKQRVVSLIEVDEVHRTAEGQSEIFTKGNVGLEGKRRGG